MANIDIEWEVEGILTPKESVEKMLAVITQKTIEDTGTFWTWEGEVRICLLPKFCDSYALQHILSGSAALALQSTSAAVILQQVLTIGICRDTRGDRLDGESRLGRGGSRTFFNRSL